MSHISPRQIDEAMTGELQSLKQVIAHLETGCEDCERLLDGVDLETLVLLVDASEAEPVRPTAAESAQIRPFVQKSSRLRWIGMAVAIAAALLLVTRIDVAPEYDGVKGGVAQPDVTLRVLTGLANEAGFELTGRLEEGSTLDPQATLLFEVDSSIASARTLFVVDQEGEATVLYTSSAVEAPGPRRAAVGEDWVAFGVEDWTGPLTIVAASSVEVHDAAGIVDGFAAGRPVPGVSYASISVVVP